MPINRPVYSQTLECYIKKWGDIMVGFKHDLSLSGFTEAEYNTFAFAYELYNAAVNNGRDVSGIKLRSSKAVVIPFGRYMVLKSYNTIVAVYDKLNNNVIVDNYYSNTTQGHVSKFIADYAQAGYTRVNLYIPSNRVILHDTGTGEIWKASQKGYVYQYVPKGGDK